MWWLAMAVLVMLLSARVVAPQHAPTPGPSLADVEVIWTAFWTHLSLGDIDGAAGYLHSSQRQLLDSTIDRRRMEEVADQMASCRLEPSAPPIRRRPDEHVFAVHCRHRGETADSYLVMRRDFDGVWRIASL